jgi:hypothetical protein
MARRKKRPRRKKGPPSVPVATRLTAQEKSHLQQLAKLSNQTFAGYVAQVLRERLHSRLSQVALARNILRSLPRPGQVCFCATGRSQNRPFSNCCQPSIFAFIGQQFPGLGAQDLFTIYTTGEIDL